jgi:NTP pyrophosphatase (non-canonical NTP hydrolase)
MIYRTLSGETPQRQTVDLSEYQRLANETDQVPCSLDADGLPLGPGAMIPLLGLAGEVGSLLTQYKKHLRDGTAYKNFREQIAEDLGDLLWYVASASTKFGFDLTEIAGQNLHKIGKRWGGTGSAPSVLFDEEFPAAEQFPREFEVLIREARNGDHAEVACLWDGNQLGNFITDNAHEDDGYRFHDVFHMSYAVMLGWSPILRKHMDRKRRSRSEVDEVEDGGRATVLEETISLLVFSYARKHNFLDGVGSLDFHLLKMIQDLASGWEVGRCSAYEWEQAIFAGYRVWRQVRDNGGGIVQGSLKDRVLGYRVS